MQYWNSDFRSSINMRKQLHNTLHVTFRSFTLALYSKNDKNEKYEVALFLTCKEPHAQTTMGEFTPRVANVIIVNCEKGTAESSGIRFRCQTLLDSSQKESENMQKESDNRQKESDNNWTLLCLWAQKLSS